MNRTQNRSSIYPELCCVQERPRVHAKEKFTSLAHYLSESTLLDDYNGLKAKAGAGIDGQTKADCACHLSANIRDLHQRLKPGRYQASPTKRVWLDKPDGGQRPIGLPTVEDKIVQSAVFEVLNVIYECDFHELSYGFLPERNQNHALQAVQTFLQKGQVNWVLDLDLKVCFETIEHDALALKARLEESLADCGLALNQAKTRLIRFGRHWPGRGNKPEIFGFLGLIHILGKDRKGRYLVLRKTARKRFRRHLLQATAWLRKQRHQPLAWQCQKLRKHLLGYYQYYGIRGNYRALARYRWRLWRLWCESLKRRGQKSNGDRLTHLLTDVYPMAKARINDSQGWMNVFPGHLLGRAGCGNAARPVL